MSNCKFAEDSPCLDECNCEQSLSLKSKLTAMETQASRLNEGKPQLSYILEFDNALQGIAKVMEMGTLKYDRGNWKKGLPKQELLDSLMRHLVHLANGRELDDESGLPHINHVLTNALFYAYHHEPK